VFFGGLAGGCLPQTDAALSLHIAIARTTRPNRPMDHRPMDHPSNTHLLHPPANEVLAVFFPVRHDTFPQGGVLIANARIMIPPARLTLSLSLNYSESGMNRQIS